MLRFFVRFYPADILTGVLADSAQTIEVDALTDDHARQLVEEQFPGCSIVQIDEATDEGEDDEETPPAPPPSYDE